MNEFKTIKSGSDRQESKLHNILVVYRNLKSLSFRFQLFYKLTR